MNSTLTVECVIENKNKKFNIEVSEWQKISENIFLKLIEYDEILSDFCLKEKVFNSVFFDITFTDSIETHELNKNYRKKDYPADIITFALFADDENSNILDGQVILGDIIIALDKVQEMAQEEHKTFEWELKFLIAHGILHLLGFDHQTEEDYSFVVKHQKLVIKELC